MPVADRLTRLSRWGLLAALILAIVSIGYRLINTTPGADAADDVASAATPDDRLAALAAEAQDKGDDVGAWQSLGWAYFDAGRHAEAVTAYRRAIELAPDRAILWSSLGEALVMASTDNPLPPEALDAFRKANELDPSDPRARYFLAVARDLTGDHEGAINDWIALLQETPSGAPWEQDLRRTIEQVGKINGIATQDRVAALRQPAAEAPMVARGIPGPNRAEMQAAAAMTPGEQRQMAEGMVAQLEERLSTEPARVDGWLMLIRSRMALGEPDKASAALKAAIKANPAEADTLRTQARMLGVQ